MTVIHLKTVLAKWEELGYRTGRLNDDPKPPNRPDEPRLEEAYRKGWWRGFEEYRGTVGTEPKPDNVVPFERFKT